MPDTVAADAYRFAPAAPRERTVYGACAPGWHTAAPTHVAVDEWLSFMRSAGVERVCCLVAGPGLEEFGATLFRYRSVFGAEKVRHVPIPDRRLADGSTLRGITAFLAEADDAGEPVVVHGLAGLGRTGQVLAAWLVRGRGYDPLAAVETVREMGREPADAVEDGAATRRDLLEPLARL